MNATGIASQTTVTNSSSLESACTYLIFTDSIDYYARSCNTGGIAYGGPSDAGGVAGTNFTAVWDASVATGGVIDMAGGDYQYSVTLGLPMTEGLTVLGPVEVRAWSGTPDPAVAQLAYSGSGWALMVNASPTWNHYGVVLSNLAIVNTGATYLGGVYCNFVVCSFDSVYLNGGSTIDKSGSTGVYLGPTQGPNVGSISSYLSISYYDKGMVLDQDHFVASEIEIDYSRTTQLQIGDNRNAGDNYPYPSGVTISYLHFFSLGTSYDAKMIVTNGSRVFVGQLFAEDYNNTIYADWPGPAHTGYNPTLTIETWEAGSSAPLKVSGTFPWEVSVLSSQNSAPSIGFQLTTPSLPSGTGSGNKVTNSNVFPVIIYQSGEIGTVVVDPTGSTGALSSDPASFILAPGASVYYASAAPISWDWYGLSGV